MEIIICSKTLPEYTFDPKTYLKILEQELLKNPNDIATLNISINRAIKSPNSLYNAIKTIIKHSDDISEKKDTVEKFSPDIEEILNIIPNNTKNIKEFLYIMINFNSFVNKDYEQYISVDNKTSFTPLNICKRILTQNQSKEPNIAKELNIANITKMIFFNKRLIGQIPNNNHNENNTIIEDINNIFTKKDITIKEQLKYIKKTIEETGDIKSFQDMINTILSSNTYKDIKMHSCNYAKIFSIWQNKIKNKLNNTLKIELEKADDQETLELIVDIINQTNKTDNNIDFFAFIVTINNFI
jgi:hypothetical protein